jgi:hypothetical protein
MLTPQDMVQHSTNKLIAKRTAHKLATELAAAARKQATEQPARAASAAV